jgi:hypothetical protein
MTDFFGKSNHAMQEIITKPNHDLFFKKSNPVLVWKWSIWKSNRAMREIIAKPNHVMSFWKVQSHLGLKRECMYVSRTGFSDGYGVSVEKEL